MAEHALFIGWGSPRTGREKAAAQLFQESVAYWQGLKTKGEIEDLEMALLASHGGDLGGFALLHGDAQKLALLRQTPDFQRLVFRAGVLLEGLGVVDAMVGDGVMNSMEGWAEAIADL